MLREFERRLASVPRWTVVPTIQQQSVATHQFFVTLYTDKLCRMLGWDDVDSTAAMRYALRHDSRESWSGDMPSPWKRKIDSLIDGGWDAIEEAATPEMGEDYPGWCPKVAAVVKLADLMDAVVFLQDELDMGNTRVLRLHSNLWNRMGRQMGKMELSKDQRQEIEGSIRALRVPDYPL